MYFWPSVSMNRKFIFPLVFVSLALVIISCSPAAQEMDRFFRYINEVREDLRGNKSEEKKQKLLTKARARLLTIIDTEYVGQLSLGKYFDDLPEEDKKEFTTIFHQILAYNLVKSYIPIQSVTDQNVIVEMVGEELKHDPVFNVDANIIHTRFINEKIVYYIDFYMHLVGKKYKLYDVHVDGASILKDYQDQFYSIISTKGFPNLLQRLKDKLKDLDVNA